MDLNIANKVLENLKEQDFVKNFIKELSNFLTNKENLSVTKDEVPIIESILSNNKLTTGNENAVRWKTEEIIKDYAKEISNGEAIYFVKDNKSTVWKNNAKTYNYDVYSVLKIQDGKEEKIEISKENINTGVKVNDIFRVQNGSFVVDQKATEELKNKIENMSTEIINKQNSHLENYRKENHEYEVIQKTNSNCFLRDITDNSKVEFEEISISKELLDKLNVGDKLKFVENNYVLEDVN